MRACVCVGGVVEEGDKSTASDFRFSRLSSCPFVPSLSSYDESQQPNVHKCSPMPSTDLKL